MQSIGFNIPISIPSFYLFDPFVLFLRHLFAKDEAEYDQKSLERAADHAFAQPEVRNLLWGQPGTIQSNPAMFVLDIQ